MAEVLPIPINQVRPLLNKNRLFTSSIRFDTTVAHETVAREWPQIYIPVFAAPTRLGKLEYTVIELPDGLFVEGEMPVEISHETVVGNNYHLAHALYSAANYVLGLLPVTAEQYKPARRWGFNAISTPWRRELHV